MKIIVCFICLIFLCGCSLTTNLSKTLTVEGIPGKAECKHTSYITAGDRVYAIGAQDGTFPEIGWHIKNEMGGVWNHPIKLLDGYKATLVSGAISEDLVNGQFTNYAFGNSFQYKGDVLPVTIEQFQFSPDQYQGLIIEYTISNTSSSPFHGKFVFETSFDLMPTWLGERTNMIDGPDEVYFDSIHQVVQAKDKHNNWFANVGCSAPMNAFMTLDSKYEGNGKAATVQVELNLKANEETILYFFITGSYKGRNESLLEISNLKASHQSLLQNKKLKVNTIEQTSKLTTSDSEFDKVYRWLKYDSDWFIREVPEIGRGIAAGYPDYPWWFGCDSEYALQGYLSIGQFEIVKTTIQLLAKLSQETNTNGRIIHEASTNGAVYNKGNLNETPQFASLVWEAYRWTGDKSLLTENFEHITNGLLWVSTEMDKDQNGFPEGAGMMEIHGLESEMVDVASYTQKAYSDASKMAQELGENELALYYNNMAQKLRLQINEKFWVEDFDSFADFMASDQQSLHLIEDAIIRADTLQKPWAVSELQMTKKYITENPSDRVRPFVVHHNWVVNTPMEMGIADSDKAKRALQTAQRFVNPYGVFVTGIDRDESAGKDTGSFKGSKVFSYTGAVMTLPTGVSAISENNYGNPDKALDYLKRMGRSFSFALPGSIYEVSPDYGMFAQAWNIYSYAVPIVQQFFGVSPMASQKKVKLSPSMPSAWDQAYLENIRIGDNEISLKYTTTNKGYQLEATSKKTDWKIEFEPKAGEEVSTSLGDNGRSWVFQVQRKSK